MKSHLYKFTIEHLEDTKGNPLQVNPLTFEFKNHDDIFKIVDTMKGKMELDEADATALAVGLKLFGEVMLRNKHNTLFEEFRPLFANFLKQIKKL